MKIIVHAGMPKTGSSAIQKTLACNRERLRSHGVVYPYFGPENPTNIALTYSHWLLAANLLPDPANFHHLARMPEAERSKYMAVDALGVLESALETAAPHETFILSAENFGRPNSAGGFADALLPLLRRFTTNIHCIAYARSPVSLYPSAIQQRMKTGLIDTIDPSTWIPAQAPQHNQLKEWFSDRYTLRIFDRSLLFNNDVVDDFIEYVRSIENVDVDIENQGDENISISLPASSIMYFFIRTRLPSDLALFRTLRPLLTRFERIRPATKFCVPSAWTSAIYANNAQDWNMLVSDAQLAEVDRRRLFLPADRAPETIGETEISNYFTESLDSEYNAAFIKFLRENNKAQIAGEVENLLEAVAPKAPSKALA